MNADRKLWLVVEGDNQTTDVQAIFVGDRQGPNPEPRELAFSFFADPKHRTDDDQWLRDVVVMILERL